MKRRERMAFLFALAFVAMAILLCAAAEGGGDYGYELLSDGTARITEYTGSAAELSVPGVLDGHAVTRIGDYAFARCVSLARITIPEGVTALERCAFYSCQSLESLSLPDSLTTIDHHTE